MPDRNQERPPVESEVIEERDVQPMGEGHVEADEAPVVDPIPPSYEANQVVRGKEVNPGGSTDAHNTLSDSDSGRTGR